MSDPVTGEKSGTAHEIEAWQFVVAFFAFLALINFLVPPSQNSSRR